MGAERSSRRHRRKRSERREAARSGERREGQARPSDPARPATAAWLALFLVLATLVVYAPVASYEFLNYDDTEYVTRNPHVRAGLGWAGVGWALTATRCSNWHPLTWLSHMLDVQVFGLSPRGHHLMNLAFHAANAALLFLVLLAMTKAVWRSLFVAALFALHPLHVESVAWVAERKDTLSTFFWILTTGAYVRYARKPGGGRALLVAGLYALGLMAKPMLVTLPFTLLLLDAWPLGRLALGAGKRAASDRVRTISLLVLEKAPLLALALASCIVTFLVQGHGGSVSTLQEIPVGARVANALVAYTGYLGKMLWPVDLAVFYPHPGEGVPAWEAVGSAVFLLAATILAIRWMKRLPALAAGWFWYLGTLAPVIGIVQVGAQAMADRYTYVPLIGPFIMAAWGIPDLAGPWLDRGRHGRRVLAIPAVLVLLASGIATRIQLGTWHDSVRLLEHALAVTKGNWLAHNNLAGTFAEMGRDDEAMAHYREALRIMPDYELAHNNLGVLLAGQGRTEEAIAQYRQALEIEPDFADAHNNLGGVFFQMGNLEEAEAQYREAIRIDPEKAEAYYNLGLVSVRRGRIDEAIEHFSEALAVRPDYAQAREGIERARRMKEDGAAPDL